MAKTKTLDLFLNIFRLIIIKILGPKEAVGPPPVGCPKKGWQADRDGLRLTAPLTAALGADICQTCHTQNSLTVIKTTSASASGDRKTLYGQQKGGEGGPRTVPHKGAWGGRSKAKGKHSKFPFEHTFLVCCVCALISIMFMYYFLIYLLTGPPPPQPLLLTA